MFENALMVGVAVSVSISVAIQFCIRAYDKAYYDTKIQNLWSAVFLLSSQINSPQVRLEFLRALKDTLAPCGVVLEVEKPPMKRAEQ